MPCNNILSFIISLTGNSKIIDLLNTRCCAQDCIGSVSRKKAAEARLHFKEKSLYSQRCWIPSYLNNHCKVITGRQQYAFAVGATPVCMEAWRVIHGIGRKRLWEIWRMCQSEWVLIIIFIMQFMICRRGKEFSTAKPPAQGKEEASSSFGSGLAKKLRQPLWG